MFQTSLTFSLLLLLGSSQALAAPNSADLEFSSGAERVALLELFTSEGCSSCPPADRWLGTLKSNPGLWNDFIPIAFHVDYWDYIGWEDRFAQAEFGDRQRRYADQGGARFVYTPGVFYDGTEWVGWRAGEKVTPSDDQVGVLTARISGETVAIRFNPSHIVNRKLSVHVAVLGMSLSTRVRAGENKGKTLPHDFVALGVNTAPLKKSGTAYSAITTLPDIEAAGGELAIVVWIADAKTQAPVQATGGFLSVTLAQNRVSP